MKPRRISTALYITAILSILFNTRLYAKVTFPALFGDNMVLQQKSNAPLWGKALPGHKVSVTTSWNKRLYETIADSKGNWKTTVSTPIYGGPYSISFTDNETVVLNNIMIGEVWLCAGQSNMEMPVAGWGEIKNYEQELTTAAYPNIRLLLVDHNSSRKPLDDVTLTQGGWQPCSPECVADFSAIAYFFARKIYEVKHVPIGIINVSWGGSVAEDWISESSLNTMPVFKTAIKKMQTDSTKWDKPIQTLDQANRPAVLYNALIHPFIPLAIRGVIWYQGESNSDKSYQYRQLFPLLINDWRKSWGIGDFPFLFVQLANFNFGIINDVPKESGLAELREAQQMALSLPETGMAVAIDVGDANQIHYKNKQEPGRRLALVALAKVYKMHVPFSGPVFRSYKIKGNTVKLYFDHVDGGLEKTDTLKGFAIAGTDKKFYWAKATIKGNKVIIYSPDMHYPVAVRYGWANNPDCNLYNNAHLPAAPFRTDNWPGITFGKE